jgi:hypothetical protein
MFRFEQLGVTASGPGPNPGRFFAGNALTLRHGQRRGFAAEPKLNSRDRATTENARRPE